MENAVLDEAYQRMRGTGPEFQGWLSNHGPMAADALIRMNRSETVDRWVDGFMPQLDDAPRPRWPIVEAQWSEVLGDPSRLGDWIAFFSERVREEPWTDLLARWWPRLLPGSVASATHCLIRTGHATRAVAEDANSQRLGELAQGLGYWAARWQEAPQHVVPNSSASVGDALRTLPSITNDIGLRSRILDISRSPGWGRAVERLSPVADPSLVPDALDDLVDAAVALYPEWAASRPIMLVHVATAPRAASLVVPYLPEELWIPTYNHAWIASATMASAYRPAASAIRSTQPSKSTSTSASGIESLDEQDLIDRVVATGDEHAFKFAEVALESFRRQGPVALRSASCAVEFISAG